MRPAHSPSHDKVTTPVAWIAVWNQHNGSEYNLWVNRFGPGTGWGAAELFETMSGQAYPGSVAIDDTGRATVAWLQGPTNYYSLWARRSQ